MKQNYIEIASANYWTRTGKNDIHSTYLEIIGTRSKYFFYKRN